MDVSKILRLVFNPLNKSCSSRRLKVQTEEDANYSQLKTKQKKTHTVCVTDSSLHLMFSECLRGSNKREQEDMLWQRKFSKGWFKGS